jgi:hypothetical protein
VRADQRSLRILGHGQAGHWGCVPKRHYAVRRKSDVRTRVRICSGVAIGGTGSDIAFTTVATQPSWLSSRFHVPRTAQAAWSPTPSPRRRSFRPANRHGKRVCHSKERLGSSLRHFPGDKHAERVRKRPTRSDLAGGADRQGAHVRGLAGKASGYFLRRAESCCRASLVRRFRRRRCSRKGARQVNDPAQSSPVSPWKSVARRPQAARSAPPPRLAGPKPALSSEGVHGRRASVLPRAYIPRGTRDTFCSWINLEAAPPGDNAGR